MTAAVHYFDALMALIARVRSTQADAIDRAAAHVAQTLAIDGLVHTFGTGHSHLLAEEAFFRAGGLAAVNPIRDSRLMMLEGALASTAAERERDRANALLAPYRVSPGDTAIVISNSGRNAVPIDMAIELRRRGAAVIAITSVEQSRGLASRHASGQRLFEVADVVIDNGIPEGDALVTVPGLDATLGPGTTVVGAAIVNAIMIEGAALAAARGDRVAILRSANLDGDERALADTLARYEPRVPALTGWPS